MLGGFSVQTVLVVLIGAAVFVLGTSNLRACLRMKRPGTVITGKVLAAKLTEKRDGENRLIQHYYEVTVQCRENQKTFPHRLKSTTEYEKGDEIKLIRNGDRLTPLSRRTVSAGMAAAIALAGMILAVFPVVYQTIGQREGSAVLAALLLLAGGICLAAFLKERGRSLAEIDGEITDVLYYRTGENKKLSKPVESYYPLIRCRIRGKERIFLSSYNSSLKTAWKKGKQVKLFYDEETQSIVEKKASPVLAAAAAVLWALALLGLVSILG